MKTQSLLAFPVPTRGAPRGQSASRLPAATLLAFPAVNDVTILLRAAQDADPHAADRLLPLVYEELRRVAERRMAAQPPGHTLQATALVHEAFLKLTVNPASVWADRRHFFAAAAEAMRHILVDRARRKAAIRHGGDQVRVPLEELLVAGEARGDHVIAVHEALARLAAHDAVAAELVQLRFFAGFTFEQAAELLGVSERTAKRLWAYARAWLFEEIRRTTDTGT
jgi:RNA polymerase sigma factor (TIGR02999 family)